MMTTTTFFPATPRDRRMLFLFARAFFLAFDRKAFSAHTHRLI
jgi:hypothetical protein